MINMIVAFAFGFILGALSLYAFENGLYKKLGGK